MAYALARTERQKAGTSVAVPPKITPQLDIWLGSSAPDAFRRIGRKAIEVAAEEAGRAIEHDHSGISPDVDPTDLIAADGDQLHRQLGGHLAAGLTKYPVLQAGSAPVTSSSAFCH